MSNLFSAMITNVGFRKCVKLSLLIAKSFTNLLLLSAADVSASGKGFTMCEPDTSRTIRIDCLNRAHLG